MKWKPIKTAPKDETPIDLWSPRRKMRLTNYYRVDFDNDGKNIFYDPVGSGICTIRDATHWMPIPEGPNIKK